MTATEAMQAIIENKYRAKIVAKLRAEADRIERGGSPICYAVNADDRELYQEVDEALKVAAIDPPCRGDEWWEGVEDHEWGVMVSVEECVKTAHAADLSTRMGELAIYALKDPYEAGAPEVMVQDCPRCGEEGVEVPPGGRCPVCAEIDEREDAIGGVV